MALLSLMHKGKKTPLIALALAVIGFNVLVSNLARGSTIVASYGAEVPTSNFTTFNNEAALAFSVTASSVDIDSFVFTGFPFSNLSTATIVGDNNPGGAVTFGSLIGTASSISGQTITFGLNVAPGDYFLRLQYSDGEQNRATQVFDASTEVSNGVDLDRYVTHNGVIGWSGNSGNSPVVTVFSSVPEPSSTALLGFGGLSLLLRRRR